MTEMTWSSDCWPLDASAAFHVAHAFSSCGHWEQAFQEAESGDKDSRGQAKAAGLVLTYFQKSEPSSPDSRECCWPLSLTSAQIQEENSLWSFVGIEQESIAEESWAASFENTACHVSKVPCRISLSRCYMKSWGEHRPKKLDCPHPNTHSSLATNCCKENINSQFPSSLSDCRLSRLWQAGATCEGNMALGIKIMYGLLEATLERGPE